jgi:hypothetical protein
MFLYFTFSFFKNKGLVIIHKRKVPRNQTRCNNFRESRYLGNVLFFHTHFHEYQYENIAKAIIKSSYTITVTLSHTLFISVILDLLDCS